jgi:hypothetical protein
MIKEYFDIIIFMISFCWHEMGHVLFLDAWGAFKGFKFTWWGIEVIVDKECNAEVGFFDASMLYLSGFIFGLVPLYVWIAVGYPGIYLILIQISVSLVDFFYFGKMCYKALKYKRLKLKEI